MIKTVIFDLGGVYFTDGTKRAIEIISSKYNIPDEKVKHVLNGDLGTKYRIGNITAKEFWRQAKEFWGIEVPSDELAEIWFEGYKPIEGINELISSLKASGYEIIFLSDNVQERVDYLQNKYLFMDKFKDGVFSHIVHVRKPDLKIYEMALEKSSNHAEECVYIDDKPQLLGPARKLGMKVISFESALQLKKKLRELGLKF